MFSEVKMLMHVRNDSIKNGNPESPSITPLYVKILLKSFIKMYSVVLGVH